MNKNSSEEFRNVLYGETVHNCIIIKITNDTYDKSILEIPWNRKAGKYLVGIVFSENSQRVRREDRKVTFRSIDHSFPRSLDFHIFTIRVHFNASRNPNSISRSTQRNESSRFVAGTTSNLWSRIRSSFVPRIRGKLSRPSFDSNPLALRSLLPTSDDIARENRCA